MKHIIDTDELEKLPRYEPEQYTAEPMMEVVEDGDYVSLEDLKNLIANSPQVPEGYAQQQSEPVAHPKASVPIEKYNKLLYALKDAKQIIKIWHGEIAWDIYDKCSPEMKRLNNVIAEAEGK